MPDDLIIKAENVTAHYGDTLVLDDVSLEIRRGEIYYIIGASGCGKTTLLRNLTGLMRPTSGHVLYNGDDITAMDEEQLHAMQRTIGIAFQSSGLFNSMTVGENVAMPVREFAYAEAELVEPIVRLKLSLVGLADAEDKLPAELSGGMRKRAGLARALAADPPVVYFDEPSAGLDPIMASGLDQLILQLNELLGTTFIIVSHELDSIRAVADRVLMLDQGQVIFIGTVEEAEHSDVDRVRQFFQRRPDAAIAQRDR